MKDDKNENFLPALPDLQELMNHFFNDSFTHFFKDPFRVDVFDMESEIVIEADLPGFNQNQIKIEAFQHGVKIIAEDYQEMETIDDSNKYFKKERSVQRVERIIPLPSGSGFSQKISSFYKDGILEIHVPKLIPKNS